MRKLLSDYMDEPIYNMKAVEQQTHIPAATLRAWERRYALMDPKRTENGYRLYSDRDVALLRWVRAQMDAGLTISRVVAVVESLQEANESIWIDDEDYPGSVRQDGPLPLRSFVQPLLDALINLDASRADEILAQAFALYAMPNVYAELIAPALVEVGEAWRRGEVLITTEHYVSAYLRGRLQSLLYVFTQRPEMPTIFIGCAPHELHEVGALIFAVILRQQGYNVVYLGQDVPEDDLVKAVQRERPVMVCLTASTPSTALQLRDLQFRLAQLEAPVPLFAYGGRAFDADPELRKAVGGYYLGEDPRTATTLVNNLLRSQRPGDKIH